jgi:hypothetical protein
MKKWAQTDGCSNEKAASVIKNLTRYIKVRRLLETALALFDEGLSSSFMRFYKSYFVLLGKLQQQLLISAFRELPQRFYSSIHSMALSPTFRKLDASSLATTACLFMGVNELSQVAYCTMRTLVFLSYLSLLRALHFVFLVQNSGTRTPGPLDTSALGEDEQFGASTRTPGPLGSLTLRFVLVFCFKLFF